VTREPIEPVTEIDRVQTEFEECLLCHPARKRRAVICVPFVGTLTSVSPRVQASRDSRLLPLRYWAALCLQHARRIKAIERAPSQIYSLSKNQRLSCKADGVSPKDYWEARSANRADHTAMLKVGRYEDRVIMSGPHKGER